MSIIISVQPNGKENPPITYLVDIDVKKERSLLCRLYWQVICFRIL